MVVLHLIACKGYGVRFAEKFHGHWSQFEGEGEEIDGRSYMLTSGTHMHLPHPTTLVICGHSFSLHSEAGKLPKLLPESSSTGSRQSGSSPTKAVNSRWNSKHDFANVIKRVKEKHGEGILSE